MSEITPSSGIDPSKDHVSDINNVPTDTVGAPTTADKYENTRHLKYGQTKNQENINEEQDYGKRETLISSV